MGLFKSKYEKELDAIIAKINMNMSNNYKDNAQANLRDFEVTLKQFQDEGRLKAKEQKFYEEQLGVYQEKLKGFTHKDQKPYWTSCK